MKCYKSNEDLPEGYVFLPGSKCHATEEECAKECGPCWRCYFFYRDRPPSQLEECACWDGTTPSYRVWPTSISWKLFYDSYEFVDGVPPEDVQDGLGRTIALLQELTAGKTYPILRTDPSQPQRLPLYGEERNVDYEDVFGPYTAQINNHWFFSQECFPDGFDPTPDPSMSWGVHYQNYKIGEDPLTGLNTQTNIFKFATEPLPDGAENADQNGLVDLRFYPFASNIQAYTPIDPCSPNENNNFVLDSAGFSVTKTFENGNTSRALFSLVNPRIEYTIGFSFQSTPEVGHYCWPTGDCFTGTKEEAFLNRGYWSPGNCDQIPCEVIEPDSFECRTERVSLNEYPVGKCHATEEECAKECPPPTECWQKYNRWSTEDWPCWRPKVTIGDYTPIENSLVMEIDRTNQTGITNPAFVNFPYEAFPNYCGTIQGSYESPIQFDCNNIWGNRLGYASNAICFGDNRDQENVLKKFMQIDFRVLSADSADLGCLYGANDFALAEGKNSVPILFDGLDLVGYIDVCLEWTPIVDPTDPNYNPDLPVPEKISECFNSKTPPTPPWLRDCSGGSGDCFDSSEECEAATTKRSLPMPTTTTGPGTELSKLLKMIGINAKEKGCSCKSHAKRMDREGPQWCRDNIETVLRWLQTEAKKRKLPFVKAAAKQAVLLAIRRAERGQ